MVVREVAIFWLPCVFAVKTFGGAVAHASCRVGRLGWASSVVVVGRVAVAALPAPNKGGGSGATLGGAPYLVASGALAQHRAGVEFSSFASDAEHERGGLKELRVSVLRGSKIVKII
jgi:hypothetical protein